MLEIYGEKAKAFFGPHVVGAIIGTESHRAYLFGENDNVKILGISPTLLEQICSEPSIE